MVKHLVKIIRISSRLSTSLASAASRSKRIKKLNPNKQSFKKNYKKIKNEIPEPVINTGFEDN